MTGRLRIEYTDGDRATSLDRPVGPAWASYAMSGSDREDLSKALDAAKQELLDAAYPERTTS